MGLHLFNYHDRPESRAYRAWSSSSLMLATSVHSQIMSPEFLTSQQQDSCSLIIAVPIYQTAPELAADTAPRVLLASGIRQDFPVPSAQPAGPLSAQQLQRTTDKWQLIRRILQPYVPVLSHP